MVHLHDLDVPVGSEARRRLLDQVAQQVDAERGVWRVDYCGRLCRLPDHRVMLGLEAGGADEDWSAGRHCSLETGFERGRRGEVDQHIAMLLVDEETTVVVGGRGNGSAHPP